MEHSIRVGAILDANDDCVRLLGYGTYLGDFIPESDDVVHPAIGVSMKRLGVPNPKIQLDSGDIVWGCECWWGPEEKVRESIGNRTVQNVNIGDFRRPEDPEAVEEITALLGELDKAE